MLRICGTVRNSCSKLVPLSTWRLSSQHLATHSEVTNPSPVNDQIQEEESPTAKSNSITKASPIKRNYIIETALNTLQMKKNKRKHSSEHDQEILTKAEIIKTQTCDELFELVNKKKFDQHIAEDALTHLLSWVNSGKVELSNIQKDKRFINLCKLSLQPLPIMKGANNKMPQDIKWNQNEIAIEPYASNQIYSGSSNDVSNMSVHQTIKVMSILAQKKKRSISLLRALSYNICQSKTKLNPKDLSTILYNLAVLNYPDEVVLRKAIEELTGIMTKIENSSIIGSIVTSLGMLRYKDEDVLNKLSVWIIKHVDTIRPQDLCSFFMTLAILNHIPINCTSLQEVYISKLGESDMKTSNDWLNYVWALTVLDLANNQHFASVLDKSFIPKIADMNQISMPKKLKLLNVNSAAQLLAKNYTDSLLEESSSVVNSNIKRSKEQQTFVQSINGAIANIYKLPDYAKLDVDSGLGFLLDAEFYTDDKGNPLPITCDIEKENGLRIAALGVCYSHMTRGKQNPLGFYSLYCRLLEKKGYKPLLIPFTEFNPEDKIFQRTLYITNRIKKMLKT